MSHLQHWQSLLDRQGLHLPESMDGLTTLLFEIVLLPMMERMCQCLLLIGQSGGSVLLYVKTSGILYFFLWFGEGFFFAWRWSCGMLLVLLILDSLFG